ncbi:MAG: nucleotide exchange factor GrpE [Alphaproteobacteria bacterium]|nr:MAG: nucleotide exchange factor GrpE [Alphaproteobacteria bacterium]
MSDESLNSISSGEVDSQSYVNSDNDLDEEIKVLREEVRVLQDKLARSNAEQSNMRVRFEKESKDRVKYVVNNFALNVLEIVDNLELALKASESDNNIYVGVQMIYDRILDILKSKGIVQTFVKLGDVFDSDFHEVIEQVESDLDRGSVVRVISHGYMIDGTVLRYAKVLVSKGKE